MCWTRVVELVPKGIISEVHHSTLELTKHSYYYFFYYHFYFPFFYFKSFHELKKKKNCQFIGDATISETLKSAAALHSVLLSPPFHLCHFLHPRSTLFSISALLSAHLHTKVKWSSRDWGRQQKKIKKKIQSDVTCWNRLITVDNLVGGWITSGWPISVWYIPEKTFFVTISYWSPPKKKSLKKNW